MKIALCSTFVPFIRGGARNIVDWLQVMLEEAGHQVEKIYLPQVDVPDLLFQQMMAFRWIDLSMADRIICFRPQAHLIPHHHKILWFIHHIRIFYDLWDSPYRGFPADLKHKSMRSALHKIDSNALNEAKIVFTNSQRVSERLKIYNRLDTEVLYPPVLHPERFFCAGFNDEILCISRVEHHKRHHLLVEALKHTRSPVKLRFVGTSASSDYCQDVRDKITSLGLTDRISFDNKWTTEEEKVQYLANCLAVTYIPFDEDSYGYSTIEAAHASKAVITTIDSGGVPEFVQDGYNGYVTEPLPEAIAEAMDQLYLDRQKAKIMGQNAKSRLKELNISWEYVLRRLLA